MIKEILLLWFLATLCSCSNKANDSGVLPTAEKIALGRLIFFDTSLSEPAGQSCATCHAPEHAFTDVGRATSEGAIRGLFGNRNSPTVCYALYIPALHYHHEDETYVGGQFWDGRGNSLAEQATDPFINPLEMGNKDASAVIAKLKKTAYYDDFTKIYGKDNSPEQDFQHMADAIAAFESADTFRRFNSKYDEYLSGKATLSVEEQKGLALFQGVGKCADCHTTTNDPIAGKPLFTDHTYDNLGIPKNPENRYYTIPSMYNPEGGDFVDLGLGVVTNDSLQNGKFRVPTLRNIDQTAPYGHNGYFATLKDIVHFYNARDIDTGYPPAEYPQTVNQEELGDLGLTPEEENAIVAFMRTLTDQ